MMMVGEKNVHVLYINILCIVYADSTFQEIVIFWLYNI